jgi:hypothetical protein
MMDTAKSHTNVTVTIERTREIKNIILTHIYLHITLQRYNNCDKKDEGKLLVLIFQNIDTLNYRFIVMSSSAVDNGKTATFIRQGARGR